MEGVEDSDVVEYHIAIKDCTKSLRLEIGGISSVLTALTLYPVILESSE